jgi:hypothetical protein
MSDIEIRLENIERLLGNISRELSQNTKLTSSNHDMLSMSQFKPANEIVSQPETKPVEEKQTVNLGPPTRAEVEEELGADIELIEYGSGGVMITAKRFLGDRWNSIHETLKPMGYKWVRDGKNSHWKFTDEPYQAPLENVEKSPGKVKVSEIEWVTGKGETRKPAEPTDDNAWSFAYKYDAQAKKSTDTPKSETVDLVNYLTKEGYEYYCDGMYVYTINGAFLSRKLFK